MLHSETMIAKLGFAMIVSLGVIILKRVEAKPVDHALASKTPLHNATVLLAIDTWKAIDAAGGPGAVLMMHPILSGSAKQLLNTLQDHVIKTKSALQTRGGLCSDVKGIFNWIGPCSKFSFIPVIIGQRKPEEPLKEILSVLKSIGKK